MSDLPASIIERRDKINAALAVLMSPERIALARSMEAIAGMFPDLTPSVSVWPDHACLYLTIASISDAVTVLRAVRQAGHALHKRDDRPDQNCITWLFGEDNQTFHVYATLTGSVCAFKQVGTKEVPVYEVHCGNAQAEEVLP